MNRALPLFVGLAPVIAVTIAYRLNVDAGILPACVPFAEGCTSISSTGRYAPGSLVFRAVLLPQAAFLVVLWWVSAAWLRACEVSPAKSRALLLSGAVGAIALVIYISFLGTSLPFYEFMRRFGIYFYFLGTTLAQLGVSWLMPRLRWRRLLQSIAIMPFLLGILNLVQKAILADPDPLENSIEWIAAILMQLWFVVLVFAWRQSGLTISVETDSTSPDSSERSHR